MDRPTIAGTFMHLIGIAVLCFRFQQSVDYRLASHKTPNVVWSGSEFAQCAKL